MQTEMPRILVIDDDPEIQALLKQLYQVEGYSVEGFLSGREGFHALKERGGDLVICDLKLPDIDGLQFIEKSQEAGIATPIILITAHAAVETAIEAMRKGAYDYISKPINPVELGVLSSRAIKLSQLEKDYAALRKEVEKASRVGDLLGKSHKMRQVFSLVTRVAASTANVLITGESGTGKEMVARAIHGASARAQEPFVAINCSAIPDNLLESELFGHKKGAFTGAGENRRGLIEDANGGTLFLDEIGDMPPTLQAKLLRVIQERRIKPVGSNEYREIDVRILAATHKDLRRAIADGQFREDLFFRLCVVPISIPPLRERSEDIPLLAEHFLAKYCEKNGSPKKKFTKAAISKLMRLTWPGNVRELENEIERAVVLSIRDSIDETDIRAEDSSGHDPKIRDMFSNLPTLEQLEREYIAYILAETGDHKDRAAEILGVNRKTLYRKEKEYGINAKETV